jgi:hypothetical protein
MSNYETIDAGNEKQYFWTGTTIRQSWLAGYLVALALRIDGVVWKPEGQAIGGHFERRKS